jgi:hypothetical protein
MDAFGFFGQPKEEAESVRDFQNDDRQERMSNMTSKEFTIKTEKIVASTLQPGDLFSTLGPDYWDDAIMGPSIGERVYIRTHTPSNRAPDPSLMVYKLTIEKIGA